MNAESPFGPAESIADAVLLEGYVLYPYRASAAKNQNRIRWQWGVVGPTGAVEDGVGEPSTMRAELPVALGDSETTVRLRLRFLRVVERRVERRTPSGWEPVREAVVGGVRHVSFDEASVVAIDWRVDRIGPDAWQVSLDAPEVIGGGVAKRGPTGSDGRSPVAAGSADEDADGASSAPTLRIGDGSGDDEDRRGSEPAARIGDGSDDDPFGDLSGSPVVVVVGERVASTPPAGAEVRLEAERRETVESVGDEPDGAAVRVRRRAHGLVASVRTRVRAEGGGAVVSIEIENRTPWAGGDRDEANRRSLIGAHVLGALRGGAFVSMTDPPDDHASVVADCDSDRLWPVLVGDARAGPLVLAAPVILEDQPTVAPESPAPFYDGLEMDEMLSLRVRTLTDDEKAEARATDPRAAAVVDAVDAMTDAEHASLHGALRGPAGDTPWWDPAADAGFDPDTDAVVVRGRRLARGSAVRLRPGRRADAHDVFYAGRRATVAAVLHDVDGSVHVAVTLDDDPIADLADETGRYRYFAPDELEPLHP